MGKAFNGTEAWHGRRSGYAVYGCRCRPCADADRAYKKAFYQANKERLKARKKEPSAQSIERNKASRKAWEAANVEKRKAYRKQWKLDNAERLKAQGRAWYLANRERHLQSSKIYHAANKDRVAELARAARKARPEIGARACARWQAKNPDKVKARNERCRTKDPAAFLAKARLTASLRRALERAATVVPFTQVQLDARMAYWGNRCYMCGGPFEAVDHVKPLSKGGAHALSNLRPACALHNTSKRHRWFGVEWVGALTGGIPEGQLIPPGPSSSWGKLTATGIL